MSDRHTKNFSSHVCKGAISRIVLYLLVIVLVASQSACTSLITAAAANDNPKSMAELQDEVGTAVAATMINFYVAGTQTAAALQTTPDTPTIPPSVPTATPEQPTPTPTAVPAIATVAPVPPPASGSQPTIWAEVDTNCRFGPSTFYGVDGYLMVGMTSYVYGRDSGYDWWYIENPQKKGRFCWVWGETTHVEGNVSAVPVVAASPQPAPVFGGYPQYWTGYGYGYNYNYYPYGCNYTPNWNCYCPCKKIKTCSKTNWICNQAKLCNCKKVCYNPCNINPCPYPYPDPYPYPCNQDTCNLPNNQFSPPGTQNYIGLSGR